MATYGNRFVFEFVSQNGDDVEIFISKKNYHGTPAYRPVGKPPILRRERNGCILGTSLEIYAECKIDKEYAELYTSSADDYLVEFYKNRVLQWRGYVSPELYSEPDIAPPYDVLIIATDGLGELKNTVFDRPDEAYSLKNHLDYILEKTGLSLDLDLISSLSWDDEVAGNDPLTLLDINVNLTHLASESDYDVLQDILTSFNAHITQQDGKWIILRKTDLYDNLPRFRQAEFGSVNKTTWWPIGILSTDIIPAKRKLTLTHENNYKNSILPSLIAGVSGGWELSSGVYYNTEEEAYILPDEAGIAYTIELPVYPLAVPLEFSINARPLFEEELREDRAVLMYYFELNGTVDGVEGTYYLYNAFDDTLGRARWQWLPPQLPGQPMYNMETWWRSDYPEDVELEVTTINGILPLGDNVVPQSIRLVVQNLPLLSSYRIAIYDIILAQADQIRGLQLIAEVGNAARESTEVSVVMSSSDDPMLAKTLYGVLHLDGGITQWRTPYNTATDLLRFLALDYAMLNALPSVRYRGTLNFPKLLTPWIPIIFTRDDTYYFVETYEYDLLNDELGVELISIPNAKVTIESETVIEIPEGSSGNSTSSSSGGGTGGVNGGTIIIDASMSDESENAVQNKVIKEYVDNAVKGCAKLDKDYVVAKGLLRQSDNTYYHLPGDAPENDADHTLATQGWVEGKGYLTSAAMTNYATKDDIKNFVTKGTTLAHYGITDAVRTSATFSPTDNPNVMGYGKIDNGWPNTGPSMIIGTTGYYLRVNSVTEINDSPKVYVSNVCNNTECGWAQLITDKNFNQFGISVLQNLADDADTLASPSVAGYYNNTPNTPFNFGNILTLGTPSIAYKTQIAANVYGRIALRSYNNAWTDWYEILTSNNIGGYALTQTNADVRYLKLSGGTLTGQLYVETSAGDRYIHSKCDTAHIAFGVGSGGNNRGIFDINDGKWWIVRNNSDYTEIVSSTMSLVGKVNVTGLLEARSGITLGGVTRTSWPTEGIAKNSILLPNNAFDNFGKIQFSQLDNALYAAAHRFNITLNGFNSDSKGVLFNGSYEDSIKVPVGQTATIRIDNNGNYIIAGYPYGKIVLSFYYQSVPASVSVRVYDTYGTPGWYTLPLSEVRGNNGGVFVFDNTSYYGITEIEITITAKADIEASLAEIDWFLTRASLSNLPVVTKFAIDQELYGTLICKGGITLGSKTITSWDDIKASGDYLPLTGGIVNGAVIINGTLRAQSTVGHNILFDGYALQVSAGLYVSSGYSFRLGGESITSWEDLKTILGLKSLAYKDSIAYSEITSKPTTLDGYGITDAVYRSANFDATSAQPWVMGYSNASYGWKATGPAMLFGTGNYYARLNIAQMATDNPAIYVSLVNAGTEYGWAQVITDKSFTQFGVKAGGRYTGAYDDDPKSANDINYPSMSGFTSHLADVPFNYGNLLAITTTPNLYVGQIAISADGRIAFRSRNETAWTDWRTILHNDNIGDYALPKAGGTISGNLTVSGALTLGDKTITSWDDIKASGDYLPLEGGELSGTLTVSGLLTANDGINLNGETITSWDSLKSGWWYQRLIHALDAPIAIDHLSYINIARALNSNDNITIEIQNSYTFYMATLIFATSSTIPNFTLIETPGRSLIWENGTNVFNNLKPNTTYKIVIDEMYAAVTTYNT